MKINDVQAVIWTMEGVLELGWASAAFAVDADGDSCGPRDPRAVAWCQAGARRLAVMDLNEDVGVRMSTVTLAAMRHINRAAQDLYRSSPTKVNDCKGLDAIREVLDLAFSYAGGAQ